MTAPDKPEPVCGPSCTTDCGMGHCYLADGPYPDPEDDHKPNEHAASPAATGSNWQDLCQRIADAIPTALTATPHVGIGDARRLKIANAVMAVVQSVLDAKDAEIKRLNALLDELLGDIANGVQVAAGWREHAQAAEAVANNVSAKAGLLRLDLATAIKRAEDAEREAARLTAELAQARADLGRYDHYAVQIGAKEPDTQ